MITIHQSTHRLGVHGKKVKNIATGALMGLSSREVAIDIQDTEIVNIPTALFFPVPMSSRINLDVRDSKLSSLGPQLLNTLESKQRHIRQDNRFISFVFSAVRGFFFTTHTQYDESGKP